MDIRLRGELDGFAAARAIQERCDIPIIYLTAHSDEETLRKVRETSPYGYILKPFRWQELVMAIEIGYHKHRMLISERLLNKHMRELNCLYGISRLREGCDSIETFLNGVVSYIPSGWRFPDIACARISLWDCTYEPEPFADTPWKQVAAIYVNGVQAGTIEICYREEQSACAERPFLPSERDLLDSIAGEVGTEIARRMLQAEQEISLRQLEKNLEQFAILGDNIRHPLQVILGWADLTENQEATEKIREQVNQINAVLSRLDQGALESDTIWKYIVRRHTGVPRAPTG